MIVVCKRDETGNDEKRAPRGRKLNIWYVSINHSQKQKKTKKRQVLLYEVNVGVNQLTTYGPLRFRTYDPWR